MRYVFIGILILAAFFAIVLPCEAASKQQTVPISNVYFLETKPNFVCVFNGRVPVIGKLLGTDGSSVTYRPMIATQRNQVVIKKARRECKELAQEPACSNRRDDDGDGTRDLEDGGCSGDADTDETDSPAAPSPTVPPSSTIPPFTGNPSEASVFGKPFSGDYPLGFFDHQFPLQFVHYDGSILTSFGDRTTLGVDGHRGYDFIMPQGVSILAAYDGTVTFAGESEPQSCPLLNSTTTGLLVAVRHEVAGLVLVSRYLHLREISVQVGQRVTKGMQIGLSGNTGCSTGPHLHFDIDRYFTANTSSVVDPYGWNGDTSDPWETAEGGTKSLTLWAPGEAPLVFRSSSLAPNPNQGNSAPVAITIVRWQGIRDDHTPNNEFIELTLDTRFSSGNTFNLGGFTVKNLNGDSFVIPAGVQVSKDAPIRVYSGSGTNSTSNIYMNRTTPIWNNDGDCALIFYPSGTRMYSHFYGAQGCPITTSNESAGGGTIEPLDYHPEK